MRRASRGALLGSVVAVLELACSCSGEGPAKVLIHDDGGAPDSGPDRPMKDARPDSTETGDANASPSGNTDAARGDRMDVVVPPADSGTDAPIDSGEPVSRYCGDAIRGLTEECDDGNADETDFCNSACRVLDRAALPLDDTGSIPPKERRLSGGHHVLAGTAHSAVVLYSDKASLGAVLYGPDGRRMLDAGIPVSNPFPAYDPPEAAVAALPGNRYAVAWTALNAGAE